MIIQYIFGGLIILAALLLIIVGVYVVCQGEENGLILIFFAIVFGFLDTNMLAGITIIDSKNSPTKQDVLDGKAIYQEAQIITGNDTIKTYDIVWK